MAQLNESSPSDHKPVVGHQPGVASMPKWTVGELPDAPVFEWKKIAAFIGPGMVMAASAIGGGEWLTGPLNTAKYGAAIFWLATFSILIQGIYNVEICRYTLYTGEPIFTGKFRIAPGPWFWVVIYLILDIGSFLPYLASTAAGPLGSMILRRQLDTKNPNLIAIEWLQMNDAMFVKILGLCIFIGVFIPLLFGGKIYNSMKALMTFKLFVVFGFLMFLAAFFSTFATWKEIGTGFFKVGTVPVFSEQDINKNGRKDEAEDINKNGKFDLAEDINKNGTLDTEDQNGNGKLDNGEDANGNEKLDVEDVNKNGKLDVSEDTNGNGKLDGEDLNENGLLDDGEDANQNGKLDASELKHVPRLDNVFIAWREGRLGDLFHNCDLAMIGFLTAMAALAGNGGLTNTPVSNYTRDQGWGMGGHVGAIPSLVGGHEITLSHEGCVFKVTEESLPRWKRWIKHVRREQWMLWVPACFCGLALPSMLSIQFLQKGQVPADKDLVACMTADGVSQTVGQSFGPAAGNLFWYLTLFCGFLVLSTSMASTADGVLRRWVDVFWTASPRLRKWDIKDIGKLYLGVMGVYILIGSLMLLFLNSAALTVFSTMMYNYALGFSCLHALVVNTTLLPKPLRAGWVAFTGLLCGTVFFTSLAVVTTLKERNNPDLLALIEWIRSCF